jgi:hypothetical protein
LQPGAGHQTHAAGASLPALIACAGHAPIAGAGHMPIAGGGHAPVAGVTGAPIHPGARNAGGRAIGPAYRGLAPASVIRSRFMPGFE